MGGLIVKGPPGELERCSSNFHVKYEPVYQAQRDQLVVVRGGAGSRLLTRAHCISAVGRDSAGNPLKVLSSEAQKIFGDFGGKISLQRSPPRWVADAYVLGASAFVRALP